MEAKSGKAEQSKAEVGFGLYGSFSLVFFTTSQIGEEQSGKLS